MEGTHTGELVGDSQCADGCGRVGLWGLQHFSLPWDVAFLSAPIHCENTRELPLLLKALSTDSS